MTFSYLLLLAIIISYYKDEFVNCLFILMFIFLFVFFVIGK